MAYWVKIGLCFAVVFAFVTLELPSSNLYGANRFMSIAVTLATPFALIYLVVLVMKK